MSPPTTTPRLRLKALLTAGLGLALVFSLAVSLRPDPRLGLRAPGGSARPDPSAPLTPAPPDTGPTTPASPPQTHRRTPAEEQLEQSLTRWEQEVAERLERGLDVSRDEELFQRLHALARRDRDRYPKRLWFLLFSPELRSRIGDPRLRPSAGDERAMAYLREVTGLTWALRVAPLARRPDDRLAALYRGPSRCPAPLLPLLDQPTWEIARDGAQPWQGIAHLLQGFHEEDRSRSLARPVLELGQRLLGSLEGKVIADVGPGCGAYLPHFREAVGPAPPLHTVDTDPFSLHVLAALSPSARAQTRLGSSRDVRLPPGECHMISLIGVHMGAGLTDRYQGTTRPWLRSMARALKPGGVMIMLDHHTWLLDQGLISKVEAAGFKQRALIRRDPARHELLNPGDWLAAFEVVK